MWEEMLPFGSGGLAAMNFWGHAVLPRPIRLLECEFSPEVIKPPPSPSLLPHQVWSCWSQQLGDLWYRWSAESIGSFHVAGDMQLSTAPPDISFSRHHFGSGAVRLAHVISLPVFCGGRAAAPPCSFPSPLLLSRSPLSFRSDYVCYPVVDSLFLALSPIPAPFAGRVSSPSCGGHAALWVGGIGGDELLGACGNASANKVAGVRFLPGGP